MSSLYLREELERSYNKRLSLFTSVGVFSGVVIRATPEFVCLKQVTMEDGLGSPLSDFKEFTLATSSIVGFAIKQDSQS